jgi:septal ring factor EnvC (AmiA/AmiB activator)
MSHQELSCRVREAQSGAEAGMVVRSAVLGSRTAGCTTLLPVSAQPDLPHKVRQTRHDLDDLYELMSQVDQSKTRAAGILLRHNNRLEELQQTLDLHSGRLDRIEDNQRRMQDNQRRMEDNQHRQFEHLSAQVAEILGVLSGPATADPAPESER